MPIEPERRPKSDSKNPVIKKLGRPLTDLELERVAAVFELLAKTAKDLEEKQAAPVVESSERPETEKAKSSRRIAFE